jgi:ATP-dependent Lon protease
MADEKSEDSMEMHEGVELGNLVPSDQLLPPNLFVLPINSPIIFPTLLAPILVASPREVQMVEEVINRQRLIGLVLMREHDYEPKLGLKSLFEYGVAVKIIKRLKMPDGSVNLLVHSMKRFKVKRLVSDKPYLVVETEYLEDKVEKTKEMDALSRAVVSDVKRLSESNPFFTEEMRLAMINAPGPGTVADLVAFALTLPKSDAQDFLETISVKERFEKLVLYLRKEQDAA